MVFDITTLHYYNIIVSTVIGFVVNIFAMYLIKTRTAKQMKPYGEVLFHNCIINLQVNLCLFVTKLQVEFTNSYLIYMLSGFASCIPYPWNILFFMMFDYHAVYVSVSLIIPFYCRYRVFCKGDIFSVYRIALLHMSLGILITIFTVLKAFSFMPNLIIIDKASKLLRGSIYMKPNGEIPNFVVTDFYSNPVLWIGIVYYGVFISICYSLMSWFFRRISNQLKSKKSRMDQKIFRFHKQINLVLIVQVIFSWMTTVLPSACTFVIILLQVKHEGLILYSLVINSWVDVMNPFFTIFFIDIYRNSIKKFLTQSDDNE